MTSAHGNKKSVKSFGRGVMIIKKKICRESIGMHDLLIASSQTSLYSLPRPKMPHL